MRYYNRMSDWVEKRKASRDNKQEWMISDLVRP